MQTIKELDEVSIPQKLAQAERVEGRGTVVWHLPGAQFVTVECKIIDDNPEGLRTKLLDVAVSDLQRS